MEWISTNTAKPIENKLVQTKIDDEKGVRNIQFLKYWKNLWFHPDGKMYVYYIPTHWRYV